MGNLFDQNNAFWRFLNKFTDLVFLNVAFLICCIPIITIGPAYTALYYAVMKTVKKERGYAMKNYFHSFKQNLLQGTAMWMIYLVLGTAAGLVLYSQWNASANGGSPQFLFWITLIIAFFLLCMIIYGFPILSRFEFGLAQMFAFSYLMAVRYFLYTVLLVIITAFFWIVGYLILPLVVIILPALYAYVSSSLIEKVFAVYMPMFEAPKEEENEGEGEEGLLLSEEKDETKSETPYKDQWYYD